MIIALVDDENVRVLSKWGKHGYKIIRIPYYNQCLAKQSCRSSLPFLYSFEKSDKCKDRSEEYKNKRQSSCENCRLFLVEQMIRWSNCSGVRPAIKLVEATGIEPVSENSLGKLSTSVACHQHSRFQ